MIEWFVQMLCGTLFGSVLIGIIGGFIYLPTYDEWSTGHTSDDSDSMKNIADFQLTGSLMDSIMES